MIKSSSIPSEKQSLWQRWTAPPDGLSPREEREYILFFSIQPLGWLVHFFYIFLFAYWEVWPLAVFNVFSTIIYTISIVLYRKQQRLNLALNMGYVEVFLHAIIATILLGWGSGAQYYLFTIPAIMALNTNLPRLGISTTTVLCALSFSFLYYYTEVNPPLFYVPPLQLAILNIFSIFNTIAITSSVALKSLSETEHAEAQLEIEYGKSESLLHNVLPAVIVDRLKVPDGGIANPNKMRTKGIAQSFSAVSILFADVVGFTPLSERLTPQETVDLLDEVFTIFDGLAEKYGVEKIRTIGDGYMVAAGAPVPLENHAQALVSMALDMQSYMAWRDGMTDTPLQVRIGINSGQAVGGIVGTTKFHYDLWGDMVNTASRMESHGLPGKIQIARPTFELIKDDFHCEPRGTLQIKGKGEMEAWFVTRTRNESPERVV